MSVDLVGFVNLVGVAYQDPRGDYNTQHYIAGFLDEFLVVDLPEINVIWDYPLSFGQILDYLSNFAIF